MNNPGGRRTARRIATTGLGVVAAGSFLAPGTAHAEPTQDEVEDRIEELNQEASGLVETYNQAEEDHKAAEAQYEELNAIVDEMAERATSLGGKAAGTLAEFVKTTRLRERPGEHPDARGMLSDLLADHETIIRQLRADLAVTMDKHGDAGTSDFLTGVMEKHEKMAWMLRAFLAG